MTQEIVRGTSNLLVANMYCMVAFKMHVFDALLFEETPNRSNSNHFYHKCFLQYFEGCPRVSSFHLNNLYSKVGD